MVKSVCPYCAVGCGQEAYVRDGRVVQIEGDPDSPVSRGRLCPKGSATLQLTTGDARLHQVLYRRPGGTEWEQLDLETAMDMIADRVVAPRRETWEWDEDGVRTARTLGIASLGGATLDNAENYLIEKLLTGLGVVQVENQARVCHSSTVAGLGTSFGRGGATTFMQDLQNSDCIVSIVIKGPNFAEAHPVGFQWVTEAKARGATVIHVDPRFTRTSALADMHVPIRAGTDIAFLGGTIEHVLTEEKYFRDYVLAYTNAATLVSDDFRDTEDADGGAGVFSGLQEEARHYDPSSWQYENTRVQQPTREVEEQRGQDTHGPGDAEGDLGTQGRGLRIARAGGAEAHGSGGPRADARAARDETLQHPRCVFQILKRHYARYTPELVEEICGIPRATFRTVCDALTANSGPDRTSAFAYAVGWTQHSTGAQYIRAASILQLLLGNIGRTGGGIQALRGHASIQGSSDIPTLFNLPMPHAHAHETLDTFIEASRTDRGFWGTMRAYFASLLKAYYGDAATAESAYCFDHLPRLTGSHSTYDTVLAQLGVCKGYFLKGENPAVGSADTRLQRLGMANLDWLVVRDFSLIESVTWWKDGPEIETGELRTEDIRTEDIRTEVFFFPAAAHTEKSGSFTNTNRWLQWPEAAVEPEGDARSDLWFMYHLGRPVLDRVLKPTSPMSVGSWLLAGYGPAAGSAALSAATGRLPRAGAVATAAAGLLVPAVAAYTGVLAADTAVPAWHDAHRELPYLFTASATAAASGKALVLGPPAQTGPARCAAALAAGAEHVLTGAVVRRLGPVAETYRNGRAGTLMRCARALVTTGAAGALLAGRSRPAAALSGLALLAGSACTRFGVFAAGAASAEDPAYTVGPQRARLSASGASGGTGPDDPGRPDGRGRHGAPEGSEET